MPRGEIFRMLGVATDLNSSELGAKETASKNSAGLSQKSVLPSLPLFQSEQELQAKRTQCLNTSTGFRRAKSLPKVFRIYSTDSSYSGSTTNNVAGVSQLNAIDENNLYPTSKSTDTFQQEQRTRSMPSNGNSSTPQLSENQSYNIVISAQEARNKAITPETFGPIDIDNGVYWLSSKSVKRTPVTSNVGDEDSNTKASQESSMSIRVGGQSTSSSLRHPDIASDQSSVMTGETPRISNLTPQSKATGMRELSDVDEESDQYLFVLFSGRLKCTRYRLILCMLAAVCIVATITVAASLASKDQKQRTDTSNIDGIGGDKVNITVVSTITEGELIKGEQIGEELGFSVSLNGDGTVMVVGAPLFDQWHANRSGRVIVYERIENSTEWEVKGQILYGRQHYVYFGYSVSISEDGNTIAASESGVNPITGETSYNAFVFQWSEDTAGWVPQGNLPTGEEIKTDTIFYNDQTISGLTISLSADGRRIAIGFPFGSANLGHVKVYEYEDSSRAWNIVGQQLNGSQSLDVFGSSVALSAEGNRLVVGAPGNLQYGGYVRCFEQSGPDGWVIIGNDIINEIEPVSKSDRFGFALSIDGDSVAIGAPWKSSESGNSHAGLAAVYSLEDNWSLMGTPVTGITTDSTTGTSIKLKNGILFVGSPGGNANHGMVSIHEFDGSSWSSSIGSFVGDQDKGRLGRSLATDSDLSILAIGAPGSESDNLPGSVKVHFQT